MIMILTGIIAFGVMLVVAFMIGCGIACNSLDFGTQVYIDGVGIRTVDDRGPQWLGSEWCDLYLGEHDACVQWGDQTRKVWRVTE